MIFPPLMNLIRNTKDENLRRDAFDVLKTLIIEIKEHIARYSTSLFSLINDFIASDIYINDKVAISKSRLNSSTLKVSSLNEIMDIIDTLNSYAPAYVKEYIYFLVPKILQVIEKTKKHHPKIGIKCIMFLLHVQNNLLDDYLYLIVPEMIGICTKRDNNMKEAAISLLKNIIRCKHFEEYIVQIIHSFVKILDETSDKMYIVQFLLHLGANAGKIFSPFLLLVLSSFKKNKILEEDYETQMQNIAYSNSNKAQFIEEDLEELYRQEQEIKTKDELIEESKNIVDKRAFRKEVHCNFEDLLREFEKHKGCKIHDDWIDWLKKTSYHLLKQNPSPLLYACSNVAEMYMPIISELYNIAFVICFKHLIDHEKETIIKCLISVINNAEVPVMVLQTILNLAEFLEREEELKLFAPSTLATVAERCNASAKALYYKEKDFDRNRYENMDALISINFDLQQPEAANGLLKIINNETKNTMKEDWYIKLHEWSEALRIFDQREDKLSVKDMIDKLQ